VTNATPLSSLFLEAFGTWFNVDTIDYSNTRELVSLGGTVLVEVNRRGMKPEAVALMLDEILSNWTSQLAMPFITATNVDWLSDAEAEAKLKLVLQEILKRANEMTARSGSGNPVLDR
jgi:hypothetical protein